MALHPWLRVKACQVYLQIVLRPVWKRSVRNGQTCLSGQILQSGLVKISGKGTFFQCLSGWFCLPLYVGDSFSLGLNTAWYELGACKEFVSEIKVVRLWRRNKDWYQYLGSFLGEIQQ